jgi:hypothetical protein
MIFLPLWSALGIIVMAWAIIHAMQSRSFRLRFPPYGRIAPWNLLVTIKPSEKDYSSL